MKSINRETMLYVLTKVLNTDTIILHYKELDTALKAYYFFRDEFYAKSKKAPVIPEDEEDYWDDYFWDPNLYDYITPEAYEDIYGTKYKGEFDDCYQNRYRKNKCNKSR